MKKQNLWNNFQTVRRTEKTVSEVYVLHYNNLIWYIWMLMNIKINPSHLTLISKAYVNMLIFCVIYLIKKRTLYKWGNGYLKITRSWS